MTKHNSNPVPDSIQNLIGHTYNRWTVVGYSHVERIPTGTKHYWHVRCKCGEEQVAYGSDLKCGNTKSCGCLRSEVASRLPRETHGMTRTRTHNIWSGMKSRCYHDTNTSYKYYGARGIGVCDRWRDSFENFLDDMGKCPSPKHSLDRIDNDGDYSPDNCRWATRKQQHRNRSDNRYVTLNGETKTIAGWAEKTGLTQQTIHYRLKNGWSIRRALTEPPKTQHR